MLSLAKPDKQNRIKKVANRSKNKTNHLIKNAKNTFIKEKLRDYQNNPTKIWEQIKSTYPSDKNNKPIQFSDSNGNSLGNKQTALLINKYFTNIGPDLTKITREMASN